MEKVTTVLIANYFSIYIKASTLFHSTSNVTQKKATFIKIIENANTKSDTKSYSFPSTLGGSSRRVSPLSSSSRLYEPVSTLALSTKGRQWGLNLFSL